MTRICSHCKKVMGYKCGTCGAASVEYQCHPYIDRIFHCTNDHMHGPEGLTHGICEECAAKVKEEA